MSPPKRRDRSGEAREHNIETLFDVSALRLLKVEVAGDHVIYSTSIAPVLALSSVPYGSSACLHQNK